MQKNMFYMKRVYIGYYLILDNLNNFSLFSLKVLIKIWLPIIIINYYLTKTKDITNEQYNEPIYN